MIRVGIVGTGWVTEKHIEALLACEGARVAAVAGRNLGRARELAAGAGAAAYGGYREMLEAESLDAAYVCLPPHLHGEVELALAGRVKAVLVEKPVGRDLATVSRVREAFARAGTIAAAGYHNRYRRAARRARDFFAEPGHRPVLVVGNWVGDMPGPAWWRDRAESGGQFVEQCTHVVDLSRWIAGDIVEVAAAASSTGFAAVAGSSVEDAVVVNARFASGAVGCFATGCFVRTGCPAELGIGLSVSSPGALCSFSGWGFDCLLRDGEREERIPAEADVFALQARAFVAAAESGDRSLIMADYADGIESLKVGLAANRSLELGGKPVAIRDLG